nr:unnamed protein product [Callosobruchus analis]
MLKLEKKLKNQEKATGIPRENKWITTLKSGEYNEKTMRKQPENQRKTTGKPGENERKQREVMGKQGKQRESKENVRDNQAKMTLKPKKKMKNQGKTMGKLREDQEKSKVMNPKTFYGSMSAVRLPDIESEVSDLSDEDDNNPTIILAPDSDYEELDEVQNRGEHSVISETDSSDDNIPLSLLSFHVQDSIGKFDVPLLDTNCRCFLQNRTIRLNKVGRPSNANIQLMYENKRKKEPTKEVPQEDIRKDGFDDLPYWQETDRSRCKYPGCRGKSYIICTKCQIPLCLNKDRSCTFSYRINNVIIYIDVNSYYSVCCMLSHIWYKLTFSKISTSSQLIFF